jgi:HlyD family secretion protein
MTLPISRTPCFLALTLLTACSSEIDSNRVVGELASDRVELVAESNEPIVEILVAEGAAVTAGDLLLRQDVRRAAARLAEAEGALREARARQAELVRGPRQEQIAAARANLDGAERELEFRTADYERVRAIAERGLAAPGDLDQAKASLDAAIASRASRRAELEERLNGTTIEELDQIEATVAQAAARRDAAMIDLERHEIRAPVDGVADTRLFEVGERPDPGQPVMVLLGGPQPHARVYVPEHLRASVRPGSTATLHVDGIAEPLDGRVRWVASEAAFTPYFALTERDRGRLSFVAKIDLEEDRERLPDGVPLEAVFHTDVTGRQTN